MSTFRKSQSPEIFKATGRTQIRKHKKSLTEDQELQSKEAFDLFDPHKTNTITYHQLKVIMRALGFDVKKSEVVQMAKQFDIDQTGKIIFQDYLQIMRSKYSERDPIQQTLKAFKLFDTQHKGKISLNDLRKVARELGQSLRQQELIAMIQQFDRDGDGQINEQQFLAIIKPSLI